MADLVIDIGNTLTKVALFEGDHLIKFEQYTDLQYNELQQWRGTHAWRRGIISSVKKEKAAWELELLADGAVYFNSAMAVGINNHYRSPQTLGADRLAAVTGARHLYPQQNNLVIGAGTCITYDWVDTEGNYYGGSISPGLRMRFNAMNHYTAALPLLEADTGFTKLWGDDTATAMQSGVQNGIKYELLGFIESYGKSDAQTNIILTGGDGIFFDTLLKNSIFAPYIKNEPYLVLKGLNAALQQHND